MKDYRASVFLGIEAPTACYRQPRGILTKIAKRSYCS